MRNQHSYSRSHCLHSGTCAALVCFLASSLLLVLVLAASLLALRCMLLTSLSSEFFARACSWPYACMRSSGLTSSCLASHKGASVLFLHFSLARLARSLPRAHSRVPSLLPVHALHSVCCRSRVPPLLSLLPVHALHSVCCRSRVPPLLPVHALHSVCCPLPLLRVQRCVPAPHPEVTSSCATRSALHSAFFYSSSALLRNTCSRYARAKRSRLQLP